MGRARSGTVETIVSDADDNEIEVVVEYSYYPGDENVDDFDIESVTRADNGKNFDLSPSDEERINDLIRENESNHNDRDYDD